VLRTATPDDAFALCALERSASTAGLGHVFGDLPFPEGDVLARWRIVLDDPASTVVLDEERGEPVGYAAVTGCWLQHFGLVPQWWGSGRVRALYAAALDLLRSDGSAEAHLWVLEENHRARAFYTRQGWRDAGVRETEVFVPYPVKMQMSLRLDDRPH
jgi:GNAT superfamily N-acetyltransferase